MTTEYPEFLSSHILSLPERQVQREEPEFEPADCLRCGAAGQAKQKQYSWSQCQEYQNISWKTLRTDS